MWSLIIDIESFLPHLLKTDFRAVFLRLGVNSSVVFLTLDQLRGLLPIESFLESNGQVSTQIEIKNMMQQNKKQTIPTC